MQINVIRDDAKQCVRLVLVGRLDVEGVREAHGPVEQLLAEAPGRLVIDLGQVPFVASLGLRLLLQTAKTLQTQGGRLVLYRPAPMVQEVLKLGGLTTMIEVTQQLDDE